MRRSRLLATLALATALVAFPLGALASHDFADVPDSNPFHNDISALVDAGVTSGCGGGNYCPSANVTREQMAAFLNRLGALAPGKTPVVNATKLDGLDSSQFVRSDVAVADSFTCPAVAMHPHSSDVGYNSSSGEGYMTEVDGVVGCGVHLPNGAVVTRLQAAIDDLSSGLGYCELKRHLVAGTSATQMAQTGPTVGTPGVTTVEDTTIDGATIDNTAYTYYASCYLGATNNIRIIAVTVEYDH